MARLGNIQEYEKKKEQRKADALPVVESPSIKPQSESFREGFQQMAQKPIEQPVLNKVEPSRVYESTRSQALGHESNQANPQKAQNFWNASPYEYWTEQVKANPGSTYAIVNQMFASKETPEEKAKREKRERLGEVFNNLGNLIGNAANLYYTSKGGQNIDLNSVNEKHRARMDAIKAKQDALDEQRKQIIMNAKLGDIKNAREVAAAQAKAEREAREKQLERNWKTKNEMLMKQLDDMYKTGQINAENKAKLEQMAFKAESDKDLEKLKGEMDRALKGTASYADKLNETKVVESLTGSDGYGYTRRTPLNDAEIRELSKYVENWDPYTTTDEESGKKTIDYIGGIADASESGMIPKEELEARGFVRSKKPAVKQYEEPQDDDTAPPSRKKKDNDNVPPSRKK